MPFIVILGFIFSTVFFLLVPLAGAFSVRQQWRKFRARIIHLSSYPEFSPALLGTLPNEKVLLGLIYGELEGIEGSDSFWIRTEGASIRIVTGSAKIWMLEENYLELEEHRAPNKPLALRFRDVGALPEGCGVFVAGSVERISGVLTVQTGVYSEPFVVFHEGAKSSVISRLLWSGRQQNEFWNTLTPVSLLAGFALISALAFASVRESGNRLWTVILSSLAVLPFAVLLPPGLLGFTVYRRLWRSARFLRSIRDLIQHGAIDREQLVRLLKNWKKFPESLDLARKQLGSFCRIQEWSAVIIFIFSLIINSFVVFWLLAQFALSA